MTVALWTHEACAEHDTGAHPEQVERYWRCKRALEADTELGEHLSWFEAAEATDASILACHSEEHLARVRSTAGESGSFDADTVFSEGSYRAARLGAGAAEAAALSCLSGEHDAAFALIRPPGHHATPRRAMGFCFFNNAAIAARAAQRAGAERVLILDWDVHHGNGTQDIFYADGSVFYYSLHQAPLYPHTGAADEIGRGAGAGATRNRPLPAGFGADEFVQLFRADLDEIFRAFSPDFTVISAGFDSHVDDPLGSLSLRDSDFHLLTGIVLDHAGSGRTMGVLEGGYNLDALSRSVVAHVRGLAGIGAQGEQEGA